MKKSQSKIFGKNMIKLKRTKFNVKDLNHRYPSFNRFKIFLMASKPILRNKRMRSLRKIMIMKMIIL